MSFSPYLGFDGTCEAAMRFYADVFGATDLQIMRYGDAPPGAMGLSSSPERVMHAQLSLDAVPLMASDFAAGMTVHPQSGVSVFHGAPDLTTAQKRFAALAEGGKVDMPLAPTFWTSGFGMVLDRFGTHWMISAPMQDSGTQPPA